jgi:programmed cell death protein 4
MGLDCHDWEKEMASMLLLALYIDVIEPDQIAKGFRNLLESVDDLSLDIPDAVDILAFFLAQAVVDNIPSGIPHKDEKSPGRGLSGSCRHAASREELSAGTASCRSCEAQMGREHLHNSC